MFAGLHYKLMDIEGCRFRGFCAYVMGIVFHKKNEIYNVADGNRVLFFMCPEM